MQTRRFSATVLVVTAAALVGATSPAPAASPSPPPQPGKVIWWDLLTEDPDAALDFYRQLFGWEIEEHTDRHWVVTHRGLPIAGISRIRSDDPVVDEAFWLVGITVDDVDAAVITARDLGATVHVEPSDVAGYARFAVISDPERVPVMLLDPIRDLGGPAGPGGWVWAELWARSPDSEAHFYSQIVGYQRERIDVANGSYELFSIGGRRCAGLLKVPSEKIAPAWAPYIEVQNLEEARARVAQLGGTVLVEPRELHSVGSVALIADPAGAAFFLYQRPVGTEASR